MILEILRRIQADVGETRRKVELMEVRMSASEDHQRGILTSLAGIQADLSQLNSRVDRIERRLDLVSV
jgi:hypothetical protein